MSYLDESGLSVYGSSLKEWVSSQESKTITSNIYPWTKTAKASAVSCYPVGGTELKPVVDFLFTETPPVSGDKGPENPSEINGVDLIHYSLIGEDLLDQSDVEFNVGVTTHSESVSEDGWIKLYAKNESSSIKFLVVRHKLKSGITFDTNKTYKIHLEIRSLSATASSFAGLAIALATYSDTDLEIYPTYWVSNNSVITPAVIELSPSTAESFNTGDYAFKDRIQCNANGGEISVEYRVHLVEYAGTNTEKIYSTINLPSTYYGGSIDLSTGLMTVTWVGETVNIFNKTSLILADTVAFRFDTSLSHDGFFVSLSDLVCDKFIVNTSDDDFEHCRLIGSVGGNNYFVRFFIKKSRLDVSNATNPTEPTASEWRQAANTWLATNQVFIVYRTNTPTTVQLTSTEILSLPQIDKYTPRLNTVYTDASTVQVGYVKSPIREEQELTQAIVGQGGNI